MGAPESAESVRPIQVVAAELVAAAETAAALAVHLAVTSGGVTVSPELAERVAAVAATVPSAAEPHATASAAAFIRSVLAQAAAFAAQPDQPPNWAVDEPATLQAQGQASATFGPLIAQHIAPQLDGLTPALHEGGGVLDVGVGVAALAISLADSYPAARITGIDVWEPSLRLATRNVERAGLDGRIALRRQDVVDLDELATYDLVWFSGPFIPAPILPAALLRCADALKPGGWLLYASYRGTDARSSALADLRTHRCGGSVLTDAQIGEALSAAGLVEPRTVLVPAGLPAGFVAARRP